MAIHEIYQVDAFTDRLFSGNPAAICPLRDAREWPSDSLLQAIALENNLSETAYFKPSQRKDADFDLRWFTPMVEAQLCGHATLASAYVLFEELAFPGNRVRFATLSGILTVTREDDLLTLDFPARPARPCPAPEGLVESLGARPMEVQATDNGIYLCVYSSEAEIRSIRPDFARLAALQHSVLITARGDEADFVSRYFAPHKGIPEDPVTGSAHCVLVPYWSPKLNKTRLRAIQASARGGVLDCKPQGDRVLITGKAVLYFHGTLAALPPY